MTPDEQRSVERIEQLLTHLTEEVIAIRASLALLSERVDRLALDHKKKAPIFRTLSGALRRIFAAVIAQQFEK